MTPTQSKTLRPPDRVKFYLNISPLPVNHVPKIGTVMAADANGIMVRWDDGIIGTFSHKDVANWIERAS